MIDLLFLIGMVGWIVVVSAILTNHLPFGPKQHTWVYCPHCKNELVADETTTCVDQWKWREAGVNPDDLVEDWHNHLGKPDELLHEYMGLTKEEYALWVEYPPVNEWEVVYKCGKCRGYSAWDFDHYPAPIRTRAKALFDGPCYICGKLYSEPGELWCSAGHIR